MNTGRVRMNPPLDHERQLGCARLFLHTIRKRRTIRAQRRNMAEDATGLIGLLLAIKCPSRQRISRRRGEWGHLIFNQRCILNSMSARSGVAELFGGFDSLNV
jgi:hypothetical protein